MDKSYLFFDIECANCFDGVGKMCSFGYVVVDEDFNVLDSDDVVMNPETEFDWYLFDPKNKCNLAYSKDYFRMQHNFEAYHSGIKKLMEMTDRKIVGFSSANDMGFLVSACERYNLPDINYACYNLAVIVNTANNVEKGKGLEEWCDVYGVDKSGLVPHKSVDDAMMTMLLAKAFCEKTGIGIEELLEKNKGIKLSVEKYLEQREISRHNKEVCAKITELYGKKARAFLTQRLKGNYAFGFKIKNNVDEAYRLANLVYKHGGILMKSLKSNGTIIVEDDCSENAVAEMKKRNLKAITVSEFCDLVRME